MPGSDTTAGSITAKGTANDTAHGAGLCNSRVGNLVPELISEIFLRCLPDDRLPRLATAHAPLMLGRICSVWRQVAWSTPQLWASFEVGLEGRRPGLDVAGVEAWIARSGSCPLSFQLRYQGRTFDRAYEDQVNAVVSTLLPHCKRWRLVMMDMPLGCVVPVTNVLSSGLSSLETFQINSRGSIRTPPIHLSPAHRLTELSLNFFSYGLFLGNSHFRSIRQLSVKFSGFTLDFLSFLEQLPSLEVFRLYLVVPGHLQPITGLCALSKLHTFELVSYSPNDLGPLLDYLHLPALENLKADLSSFQRQEWPYLTGFLRRCQPPLKKLTIRSSPMTPREFVECLRQAPHLDYLCADDPLFTDEVLRALTFPASQPADAGLGRLCPLLTTVEFTRCRNCSEIALVDMILSRWRGMTREMEQGPRRPFSVEEQSLRKIIINKCYQFPLRRRSPQLAKCIAEGLEFDILR